MRRISTSTRACWWRTGSTVEAGKGESRFCPTEERGSNVQLYSRHCFKEQIEKTVQRRIGAERRGMPVLVGLQTFRTLIPLCQIQSDSFPSPGGYWLHCRTHWGHRALCPAFPNRLIDKGRLRRKHWHATQVRLRPLGLLGRSAARRDKGIASAAMWQEARRRSSWPIIRK